MQQFYDNVLRKIHFLLYITSHLYNPANTGVAWLPGSQSARRRSSDRAARTAAAVVLAVESRCRRGDSEWSSGRDIVQDTESEGC